MVAPGIGGRSGGQAEMHEDLGDASSARQAGPSLGLAFTGGCSMAAMIFKAPPH